LLAANWLGLEPGFISFFRSFVRSPCRFRHTFSNSQIPLPEWMIVVIGEKHLTGWPVNHHVFFEVKCNDRMIARTNERPSCLSFVRPPGLPGVKLEEFEDRYGELFEIVKGGLLTRLTVDTYVYCFINIWMKALTIP
jgi:hypothetical protein